MTGVQLGVSPMLLLSLLFFLLHIAPSGALRFSPNTQTTYSIQMNFLSLLGDQDVDSPSRFTIEGEIVVQAANPRLCEPLTPRPLDEIALTLSFSGELFLNQDSYDDVEVAAWRELVNDAGDDRFSALYIPSTGEIRHVHSPSSSTPHRIAVFRASLAHHLQWRMSPALEVPVWTYNERISGAGPYDDGASDVDSPTFTAQYSVADAQRSAELANDKMHCTPAVPSPASPSTRLFAVRKSNSYDDDDVAESVDVKVESEASDADDVAVRRTGESFAWFVGGLGGTLARVWASETVEIHLPSISANGVSHGDSVQRSQSVAQLCLAGVVELEADPLPACESSAGAAAHREPIRSKSNSNSNSKNQDTLSTKPQLLRPGAVDPSFRPFQHGTPLEARPIDSIMVDDVDAPHLKDVYGRPHRDVYSRVPDVTHVFGPPRTHPHLHGIIANESGAFREADGAPVSLLTLETLTKKPDDVSQMLSGVETTSAFLQQSPEGSLLLTAFQETIVSSVQSITSIKDKGLKSPSSPVETAVALVTKFKPGASRLKTIHSALIQVSGILTRLTQLSGDGSMNSLTTGKGSKTSEDGRNSISGMIKVDKDGKVRAALMPVLKQALVIVNKFKSVTLALNKIHAMFAVPEESADKPPTISLDACNPAEHPDDPTYCLQVDYISTTILSAGRAAAPAVKSKMQKLLTSMEAARVAISELEPAMKAMVPIAKTFWVDIKAALADLDILYMSLYARRKGSWVSLAIGAEAGLNAKIDTTRPIDSEFTGRARAFLDLSNSRGTGGRVVMIDWEQNLHLNRWKQIRLRSPKLYLLGVEIPLSRDLKKHLPVLAEQIALGGGMQMVAALGEEMSHKVVNHVIEKANSKSKALGGFLVTLKAMGAQMAAQSDSRIVSEIGQSFGGNKDKTMSNQALLLSLLEPSLGIIKAVATKAATCDGPAPINTSGVTTKVSITSISNSPGAVVQSGVNELLDLAKRGLSCITKGVGTALKTRRVDDTTLEQLLTCVDGLIAPETPSDEDRLAVLGDETETDPCLKPPAVFVTLAEKVVLPILTYSKQILNKINGKIVWLKSCVAFQALFPNSQPDQALTKMYNTVRSAILTGTQLVRLSGFYMGGEKCMNLDTWINSHKLPLTDMLKFKFSLSALKNAVDLSELHEVVEASATLKDLGQTLLDLDTDGIVDPAKVDQFTQTPTLRQFTQAQRSVSFRFSSHKGMLFGRRDGAVEALRMERAHLARMRRRLFHHRHHSTRHDTALLPQLLDSPSLIELSSRRGLRGSASAHRRRTAALHSASHRLHSHEVHGDPKLSTSTEAVERVTSVLAPKVQKSIDGFVFAIKLTDVIYNGLRSSSDIMGCIRTVVKQSETTFKQMKRAFKRTGRLDLYTVREIGKAASMFSQAMARNQCMRFASTVLKDTQPVVALLLALTEDIMNTVSGFMQVGLHIKSGFTPRVGSWYIDSERSQWTAQAYSKTRALEGTIDRIRTKIAFSSEQAQDSGLGKGLLVAADASYIMVRQLRLGFALIVRMLGTSGSATVRLNTQNLVERSNNPVYIECMSGKKPKALNYRVAYQGPQATLLRAYVGPLPVMGVPLTLSVRIQASMGVDVESGVCPMTDTLNAFIITPALRATIKTEVRGGLGVPFLSVGVYASVSLIELRAPVQLDFVPQSPGNTGFAMCARVAPMIGSLGGAIGLYVELPAVGDRHLQISSWKSLTMRLPGPCVKFGSGNYPCCAGRFVLTPVASKHATAVSTRPTINTQCFPCAIDFDGFDELSCPLWPDRMAFQFGTPQFIIEKALRAAGYYSGLTWSYMGQSVAGLVCGETMALEDGKLAYSGYLHMMMKPRGSSWFFGSGPKPYELVSEWIHFKWVDDGSNAVTGTRLDETTIQSHKSKMDVFWQSYLHFSTYIPRMFAASPSALGPHGVVGLVEKVNVDLLTSAAAISSLSFPRAELKFTTFDGSDHVGTLDKFPAGDKPPTTEQLGALRKSSTGVLNTAQCAVCHPHPRNGHIVCPLTPRRHKLHSLGNAGLDLLMFGVNAVLRTNVYKKKVLNAFGDEETRERDAVSITPDGAPTSSGGTTSAISIIRLAQLRFLVCNEGVRASDGAQNREHNVEVFGDLVAFPANRPPVAARDARFWSYAVHATQEAMGQGLKGSLSTPIVSVNTLFNQVIVYRLQKKEFEDLERECVPPPVMIPDHRVPFVTGAKSAIASKLSGLTPRSTGTCMYCPYSDSKFHCTDTDFGRTPKEMAERLSRKEGMKLVIPQPEVVEEDPTNKKKKKPKKKKPVTLWKVMKDINIVLKAVAEKVVADSLHGFGQLSSGRWYSCDETAWSDSSGEKQWYGGVLCYIKDDVYLNHACARFIAPWKFIEELVGGKKSVTVDSIQVQALASRTGNSVPDVDNQYYFLMDKALSYEMLEDRDLEPCALDM